MKTKKRLLMKQELLNDELAWLFSKNGIKNFRLLGLGNSIISGYSMVRTTEPLLLRNESLVSIMKKHDIAVECYHYARAQNNNDEHLYDWLVLNTKLSEIHKMNRSDYGNGTTSMPTHNLDLSKLEEYYPLEMAKDLGLQEAVLGTAVDMANVIVYNGCTGSFLDNVTRGGKATQMFSYGIKRDTCSLEAILKFIQANNRENNTNTQVYICGVPNFLGLGLSEIINTKLKSIAQRYANVVYVKPIVTKVIYKPLNLPEGIGMVQVQRFLRKYIGQIDVHCDEEEYLQLNNRIIEAIRDNYLMTQAMIDIDRDFYKFSKDLEISNSCSLSNDEYIRNFMEFILTKGEYRVSGVTSKEIFDDVIREYLLSRAPYDFHYLKKKNIKKTLANYNSRDCL